MRSDQRDYFKNIRELSLAWKAVAAGVSLLLALQVHALPTLWEAPTLKLPQTPDIVAQLIELEGRAGNKSFEGINKQLALGDHQSANERAQEYIRQNGEAGLAYEVLGAAQLLAGDVDAAISSLTKATQIEPDSSGAFTKLGTVYMARGDFTQSKVWLSKALSVNSSDRYAHQRLGLIYENKGDHRRAVEHFRKGLVGAPPSYLGVAVNMGRSLNQLELYGETLDQLAPRAPLESDVVEAHAAVATAYLASEQFLPASVRFQRVLELDPKNTSARLGLGMAQRGLGALSDATATFELLIDERSDWALAYLELGATQLLQGGEPLAKNAFEKALSLGAKPLSVDGRLAKYYKSQKQFDKAAGIYQRLLKSDEVRPDYFVQLAEFMQAKGDHQAGLQYLDSGLKKYPGNAYLYFRKGNYLAALAQYQRAAKALSTASELAPGDLTIIRTLGLVQAKGGQHEAAAKSAEKVYKQRRKRVDDVAFYATRLDAAGKIEQAEEVYREALDLAPDNVVVLNNLAYVLSKLGKLDEAESMARKVNELVPGNPKLVDTLGWILHQNGKSGEAKELLVPATKVAPDSATLLYHTGVVLASLGEQREAKLMLERAINLTSDADWIEAAKKQLSNME